MFYKHPGVSFWFLEKKKKIGTWQTTFVFILLILAKIYNIMLRAGPEGRSNQDKEIQPCTEIHFKYS